MSSTLVSAAWTAFGSLEQSFVLLVLVATLSCALFYRQCTDYPAGPLPVPLLGNMLSLLGNIHMYELLASYKRKFGVIYTVWFGPKPTIILSSIEGVSEALKVKKNDFNGCQWSKIWETIFGHKAYVGLTLCEYGQEYEAHRRVFQTALLKYAFTEQFTVTVREVVVDTVQSMRQKFADAAFDPRAYMNLIVYNILAESVYGQRYSAEDEEVKRLKQNYDDLMDLFPYLVSIAYVPGLKYVLRSQCERFRSLNARSRGILTKYYSTNESTFDERVIRNICDAFVSSKREAVASHKNTSKFLTDDNLSMNIIEMFIVGTHSTSLTLDWTLLFLANFTECQRIIREELEEVVGEGPVTLEHRTRCHYLQAFIAESLRYRPVTPFLLGHVANSDSVIFDHKVKKDTSIGVDVLGINMCPHQWPEPYEFRPERFLDQKQEFDAKRREKIVSFGIGRRSCPGKMFALNFLFFSVANLLIATRRHLFEVSTGTGTADIRGDVSMKQFLQPNSYAIKIKSL